VRRAWLSFIPLLQDCLLSLLREHRAQASGDHLLLGFLHRLEQVPGEMHAAALPVTALQYPADRVDQIAVGNDDHPLDRGEAARSFIEPINWLQDPSLSLSPTFCPISSLRPSALTAMATTTALEQTCIARPRRPWT